MLAKKIFVLAAVVVSGAAFAGIATIDMEAAVRAHPNAAENDAKLKATQAKYTGERDELLESVREKQQRLLKLMDEASDQVLSEKARKEKLDECKELRLQLAQEEKNVEMRVRQLQKDLREYELLLFNGVLDDIRAAVTKIAEERGYEAVLDKSAMRAMAPINFVVYSADGIDITDEVIKAIGGKADEGAGTAKD